MEQLVSCNQTRKNKKKKECLGCGEKGHYIAGVWESSAPSNLAPLHEKIFKHPANSTPLTPPFFGSSSRGAPPILGADGVEEKLPTMPSITQ